MSETIELPVINISTASVEAGKEMLAAAVEYGFLYIDSTSTQFGKKTVDEMFELSRRFFKETPFAEKDRFRISGDNRGWSGMHSETLDPDNQERGDFKDNSTPEEPRREIARSFVVNNLDITNTFNTHSKILIFALNGPAVGLSAALAGFADFVYAAPHTFLLTPFASLGLVTEGAASVALVQRLGLAKANEALIMGKRIGCDELVATGFVNRVFSAQSGREDDDVGFLARVFVEIEERLGEELNQESMLMIKGLIRAPYRDVIEKANVKEVFAGMQRFCDGIPQEEFMKLASGQKRHKM
ncbi:hypothetical protein KEM56_000775 [Ascosphaera pollenicola]|nr:hypothetical protein KEM56_000775 [Ascosphaera pollenicola]